MEIINLAGYTIEEKLHIARSTWCPGRSRPTACKPGQVTFKDEAIVEIISNYTREAGVRNVEREIGTICRKFAREVAEASNGNRRRFTVNDKKVHELLGRPHAVQRRQAAHQRPRRGHRPRLDARRRRHPLHRGDGHAGDRSPHRHRPARRRDEGVGDGGDELRAQHSPELGLDDDYFQTHDIHVHVPAGAIPKDGPSAGVTMAIAICSLVTDTPVNNDVAMTGEVTLTGQVLPIGGLKEKILAAQRAGITTVILPSRNEADLEDVPEELRKGMTFVPVDRVEQVWEAAMGLRLDERAAQLIEAGDLIEEAGELLEKARRKAGNRVVAEADGRAAATAREKPARKAPARKAPAKPGGQEQGRSAQGGAGQAQGRGQEDHGRARPERPQEVGPADRVRRRRTQARNGRGGDLPGPSGVRPAASERVASQVHSPPCERPRARLCCRCGRPESSPGRRASGGPSSGRAAAPRCAVVPPGGAAGGVRPPAVVSSTQRYSVSIRRGTRSTRTFRSTSSVARGS